jgi:UDP-glucose 4-epimerase
MPYIAQVASGKLDFLNIFGNDYDTKDGTGIRDYLHVMDLSEGHVAALNYLSKNVSNFSVINLGTGEGCSVLELVNLYESASSKRINFKIGLRRPGDIAASYAEINKAKTLLNWNAKRNLKQMCEDSWRWECSRYKKT